MTWKYIENPKDISKKLLERINEFSKAAAYKNNIPKYITFLYTKNRLSESENKEKIPFTTASRDF